MNCYLCGNENLVTIFTYDKPDKYLEAINVKHSHREWLFCPCCELYQNNNHLTEESIKDAYSKYRDVSMRGTTVDGEFSKITSLSRSENLDRVVWLNLNINRIPIKKMLDIGSGLGVFPYEMSKTIQDVVCVEPEHESVNFIRDKLGLPCHAEMYQPYLTKEKYDLVTLVHVLEHFLDPVVTLLGIHRSNIKESGILFIEVPDAIEFDYLPQEHDEFNSLHNFFFSVSTLDRLLRKVGFVPYKIERVRYKERNLARIRMLCRAE